MRAWTPVEEPTYSRFVELSLGRTRFEVGGPPEGRPVVLVHGLSYPMEVWSPLFRHLTDTGHRVCRYDLPGRGLSSYDGAKLSSLALARHLFELLDAVGFRSPTSLVSLSNADLVLTEAALLAPSRVASLVWLAPSGLDPRTMNGTTRFIRALPLLHGSAGRALAKRCARRIEGHLDHLDPNAPETSRFAYQFALRSIREGPVFAGAALSQLLHAPNATVIGDSARRLANSNLPVTAVRFRNERDSDKNGVSVLLGPLKRCEHVELAGTHMGLLEAPTEVNACVVEQLARTPRSPP
jgi:pimeloyl-ACP methyl ester carboxylesterase